PKPYLNLHTTDPAVSHGSSARAFAHSQPSRWRSRPRPWPTPPANTPQRSTGSTRRGRKRSRPLAPHMPLPKPTVEPQPKQSRRDPLDSYERSSLEGLRDPDKRYGRARF